MNMILYPAQIDNSSSLPATIDNLTPVRASVVNNLRDAILAVEQELGTQPSGPYTTVKSRLDELESDLGNLQIISLAGDLGGTLEEPTVIKLQGQLVSNVQPQINQVLLWNGLAWEAGYPPSEIINVAFGKDISGNSTEQTVVGLQGRPLLSTAPAINKSIAWNGTQWEPKYLYVESLLHMDFSLLFSPSEENEMIVEVGESIQPDFTVSYTNSPTTAILTDTQGSPSKNVTGQNTFNSNVTFTKNNFGESVEFTLTASKDEFSKTSNSYIYWGSKIYYGVATSSSNTQTFIKSLSSSFIATTPDGTYTFTSSTNEKLYIAYRTAYGTKQFYANGFPGGFTQLSNSISVTNDFGFSENYTLFESDNANLGNVTLGIY